MQHIKLILLLSILTSHPVWAYIDPSSGSLLLQAILAGVVGIGVYFKNIRLWIVGFFGGNKDKTQRGNE